MHVLMEKLRAPGLRVTDWVRTGEPPLPMPLSMADLRGRVVLVDFWDYSCVNCLHTLPYLAAWHRRYAEKGLVILGLHAPEFSFAREPEQVAAAVERLEIPYPVAIDNDFQTWNAFANRAWPAKYLIDAAGYIRAYHHGEGEYEAFERQIQQLLSELHPAEIWPEPLPALQAVDRPGAVCLPPTPELYLGTARSGLGNREGQVAGQGRDYADLPDVLLPDTVYLEGSWLSTREAIESAPNPATPNEAAALHVVYGAAAVNCVMQPASETPLEVSVWLDGQPAPPEVWGADVALVADRPVIRVDAPRMYEVIRHAGFERHRLTLGVSQSGLRAYALTFVGCAAPEGSADSDVMDQLHPNP